MVKVDSGRLTNPVSIDAAAAGRLIMAGDLKVIQFDAPPADSTVLAQVNALCREHGAAIQVRFFGFYRAMFDAALLRHLPDVVSLAVDCLSAIDNADVLAQLPRLERLGLGVHEFDQPGFLEMLGLEQLTHLSLGETRKRNVDLAPLARCAALEQLFVHGHSRNAEVIANLPRLSALTLSSFPKRVPLDFLNRAQPLRQLRLLLGSRDSIAGLTHPGIERLGLCWVRGLSELGPLGRLEGLRELSVEYQLRLSAIDLRDSRLERLRLWDCKTLARVEGLAELGSLRELLVSQTALELDGLRDAPWGPAVEAVGLFSGKARWNDAARDALAARGIRQRGGLWLWT